MKPEFVDDLFEDYFEILKIFHLFLDYFLE